MPSPFTNVRAKLEAHGKGLPSSALVNIPQVKNLAIGLTELGDNASLALNAHT